MNKKKQAYTPRKNEFILLCLLLFIGVGAFMLSYLVLPAWEEYNKSLGEHEKQRQQLDTIITEYASLDEYKLQNEEINKQIEGLRGTIPSYFSQEEIISAINSTSAQSGLSLQSISFAVPVIQDKAFFIAGFAPAAAAGDITQQSGELVTSERITLSFTGTYDSLRAFIEAYELYTTRVCFRETAIAANEEGIVSGKLTMLVFSMSDSSGGNQELYHYDAPQAGGRTDPFTAFENYVSPTDFGTAASAPDFYVILNTYDDNANKIQMGRYPIASTQIASNRNDNVTANLSISGSGNELSYSYQLGDRSYSETIELTGDTVNISILSRNRKNENDNVGITLNVANDSNKKIVITVKNDDQVNPRFVLGTISGEIQVVS